MPLNAHPPTVDGAAFDAKVAAARASAQVDFALWGGLVPGNLDRLDELAERGVVGFKAFMCDTRDRRLRRRRRRRARRGHGARRRARAARRRARGAPRRRCARHGRRRLARLGRLAPAAAELAAIERAIALAEETGCSLHVVHVSHRARASRAVAEARARGVDVTCETCPHYLALTEDDLERLGALAKCAPPLRAAAERDALWEHLAAGGSRSSPPTTRRARRR